MPAPRIPFLALAVAVCLLSSGRLAMCQSDTPTDEFFGSTVQVTVVPYNEADVKVKAERAARWQKSLSGLAKRENATIVMALDLLADPPIMETDKPYGEATMKTLGLATRTQWKQILGVQTFALMPNSKMRERTADALKWITALPDPLFRRLCAGKVRLSELDAAGQDVMLPLACFEPAMAFDTLGRTDSVVMRIHISPSVRYTDPKTGAAKRLPIDADGPPVVPAAHEDNVAPTPLERAPRGSLKFGHGEVVTLRELAARAETAFGLIYEFDWRLADSRYFVCGSFDRVSFDKALDIVTTVPHILMRRPFSPDTSADVAMLRARMHQSGPQKIDVSGLRMMMRLSSSTQIDQVNQQYGPSEQLDAAGFLDGATVSAATLCQNMPGLSAYLDGQHVAPDTMLTLGADFGIAFGLEGGHDSTPPGVPNPGPRPGAQHTFSIMFN